jgi:hypothetical protein
MRGISKYILRLELLLLIAEILFLLPLQFFSRVIKHRFDQYIPSQPWPALMEICFRSGWTPYAVCMIMLCGLYAWDCHIQDKRGSFFLITSLALTFLVLTIYLLGLALALTWRGSVWQTPPFGL